jgi:hypothetical protein
MPFDSSQPSGPGAPAGACSPASQSQVRRTFARWGDLATGPNPTPLPSPINNLAVAANLIKGASGSSSEANWWTAEVNAVEVIRSTDQPEVLLPLSVQQIQSQGLPSSKMWAQVGFHKEGIGRRGVIDIGAGMRISAHACSISIDLIVPPDTVSLRGNTEGKTMQGPGLFLDTIYRLSVQESFAPVRGLATLTQTFVIDDNATQFVPTPPGAVGLRISLPGAAPVAANAGNWVENNLGALGFGPISPIPFSTGCPNVSCLSDRPGNAAGVATTNVEGTPRVFTYVWHLEF